MHWFDDLARRLATGRVTRGAALAGLGLGATWLSATGATPQAASAAEFGPYAHRRVRGSALQSVSPATAPPVRAHRGVRRPRSASPGRFSIGPCTYERANGTDAMTYAASTTANGQTIALTVERRMHIPAGSDRARLSVAATNVFEVTADGSSVVRLEAKVSRGHVASSPHGTVSIRYGPMVGGARGADVVVSGGSVRGTVLGAVHRSFRSNVKTLSATFVEGVPATDLAVDANLYAAIERLFERFASERGSCTEHVSRRSRARRTQSRSAFLAHTTSSRDERIVANVDRAPARSGGAAGVEPQNQYGAPSTPHCSACMQTAGNQMTACWQAAGIGAVFGCFLCSVSTLISCQAEATGAAAACWIPGAGCGEVICGVGTSCDSGDSCCGTDCCTGSDVCLKGSNTCCPPGYTTSCSGRGGYDPFCCGQQEQCCGDDLCCPAGSTCCGSFCCEAGNACCGSVCCDAGAECTNAAQSLCCRSGWTTCGPTCCDPNGQVCLDATRGVCGAPGDVICGGVACAPGSCLGAGTANAVCCAGPICGDRCCSLVGPQATPGGRWRARPLPVATSRVDFCARPNVPCHTQMNGSAVTLCCEPGQLCCGDACCAPGLTCCPDAQGNPRCNQCIK